MHYAKQVEKQPASLMSAKGNGQVQGHGCDTVHCTDLMYMKGLGLAPQRGKIPAANGACNPVFHLKMKVHLRKKYIQYIVFFFVAT